MKLINFKKNLLLIIYISIGLIIPFNGYSKDLKTDLDNYLKNLPEKRNVSIYLEILKNNQKYLKDTNKVVSAASIIKLPVMAEIMEQAREKKLKLDDTLTLKSSDKVPGGILKYLKNNTKVKIKQLVFLMITESDNTAANMLINKAGMTAINNRIKKWGLKNTELGMLIFDLKAYRLGKDNTTTANDMGILLKKIYSNQIATPELCRLMTDILKKTKNGNAIPRYIKGVPIAHKTGSLSGIKGDAGIILGSNPYVLCVFVRGQPESKAENIIAEIARISFEFLK